MEQEGTGYEQQNYTDPNLKLRDLETKQNLIKERVLLIGQNLIDSKEKTQDEILNLKKDFELIKQDMVKMKKFLEMVTSEFAKFAKKDDLEILSKQAKMFQPLD